MKIIPKHIAIIMDGNRRWAESRGENSEFGHLKGAEVVIDIVKHAKDLGVRILTLYSFSTENWKREKNEVHVLMDLIKLFLVSKRDEMIEEGICLKVIGNIQGLPSSVQQVIADTIDATKNQQKINLVLALNYGGRDDILRAAKKIALDVSEKKLDIKNLDENKFSLYLDTAAWEDPELFIRTSGELRVSNFLLWQISYSEIYSTKVLWPDFGKKDLTQAIDEFNNRRRRMGE